MKEMWYLFHFVCSIFQFGTWIRVLLRSEKGNYGNVYPINMEMCLISEDSTIKPLYNYQMDQIRDLNYLEYGCFSGQ